MSDKKSLPSGWGKQTTATSVWQNKESKKENDRSDIEGKKITHYENNIQSETDNKLADAKIVQEEKQSASNLKEEKTDDLYTDSIKDIEIDDNIVPEKNKVLNEKDEEKNKDITDSEKELDVVDTSKSEVKSKKLILILSIVTAVIVLIVAICFIISGKDSKDDESDKSISNNRTEEVSNSLNSSEETTVDNKTSNEEQTTEEDTTEIETTEETTEEETTTVTEVETTTDNVVNSINIDEYANTLWTCEEIEREIYIYYASGDLLCFNLCYTFNGVPEIDNVSAKVNGNKADFVWAYQTDVVRGTILLEDGCITLDITESSLYLLPISKRIYSYKERNNYEEDTTTIEEMEESTSYYEEETTIQSNSSNNITYESIVDWSAYVGKWSSEKVAHTHGEKKCYDVVLSLELYEEDNSIYYKLDMCNGNALYNTSRGWLYSDGDGTYSGRDNKQINIVELGVYNGGVHLLITNTYNIFDYMPK